MSLDQTARLEKQHNISKGILRDPFFSEKNAYKKGGARYPQDTGHFYEKVFVITNQSVYLFLLQYQV